MVWNWIKCYENIYYNEEWLEINSNNWAIAYYGIGKNSSSKEIKLILHNINKK